MRASNVFGLFLGGALLAVSGLALAENAVTTDPASVRAGPDSSYPEVALLDADTPIQVMGCLDDWSWCDVAFEGNRGWLYSPDITYEYQGGYVPFYSYAPAFGVPVLAFSIDAYWGSYYHDRPWYRERDEWVRRPMHHQRPPGPPPSRGLPPRELVRADRPHAGSGQPLRLGSAEPAHRDADRRDADRRDADRRGDVDRRAPERRDVEQRNAEQRDGERRDEAAHAGSREVESRPAERVVKPQEHAMPVRPQENGPRPEERGQRPEEHGRSGAPADAQKHEQRRSAPAKEEAPAPHRDDQGDRPKY
jgi:uncharacterized protein YraI